MTHDLPPSEASLVDLIASADLEPNAAWRAVRESGVKVRPTSRRGSVKLYDRAQQRKLLGVLAKYAARCNRYDELGSVQALDLRVREAWDEERTREAAERIARQFVARYVTDKVQWLAARVQAQTLAECGEIERAAAERIVRNVAKEIRK